MDISTRTVTTKVHTATATMDVLKGVAVAAVKNQLGLADDVIVSSSAEIGADGSVTVEVVEAVADAPKADETQASLTPPNLLTPAVVQPII